MAVPRGAIVLPEVRLPEVMATADGDVNRPNTGDNVAFDRHITTCAGRKRGSAESLTDSREHRFYAARGAQIIPFFLFMALHFGSHLVV